MGASFRRDGRGLLSKCNTVWTNPLLHHWSFVPSCGRFRSTVGMGNGGAASRSVPPRRLRHVLPRSMCRDSVRQIPKGSVILSVSRPVTDATEV